jgi:hypothetical protein
VKWLVFLLVTFFVLYPKPGLFFRHVNRWRDLDALPQPDAPGLDEVAARLDGFLARRETPEDDPAALLAAVQQFVQREIPYAWDWDVWWVADYVPTIEELLAKGREDCDGQAVLAAALLRKRGVDAHLVGGSGHMWVVTPVGETMSPIGPPVVQSTPEGLSVRWREMFDVGELAIGVHLFPWQRELIILLTLWLLFLPLGVRPVRAGMALTVLLVALLMLRHAGADPRNPNLATTWLGLFHACLPLMILRRGRRKREKHTDRSGFSIRAATARERGTPQ